MPLTTEPWGQRTCYVAVPGRNLIEIGKFIEGNDKKETFCNL
jgi:lactoylglutathione lyase